jgi:hypothetical protein
MILSEALGEIKTIFLDTAPVKVEFDAMLL